MYNLDVGEHYYSPLTSYVEAERGTRGETPGAMTFDERLARQWLHGRRYEATETRERYARASSLARNESANSYLANEMSSRASRAASEMRTASTRQTATASRQQMIQASMASSRQEASAQRSEQRMMSSSEQRSSQQVQKKQVSMASQRAETKMTSESKRRIEDDVCKKISDIRMSPWSKGQELDEANAASARARARILELERELEEITKKAMTTQTRAMKTAKQMAAEAMLEDESNVQSSFKKTKQVMIESKGRIN